MSPNEGGLWRRFSAGLARTASRLGDGIAHLGRRRLDKATLQTLEDLLIEADLGAATAEKIVAAVGKARPGHELDENEIKSLVAHEIETILAPAEKPFAVDPAKAPFIVLGVGVNGSGKTTTLGKLAAKLQASGDRVILAAADTFRAAAIEQLVLWGERVNAPVVAKAPGADPAGIAFEAIERARAEKIGVLLIDTAGRLQNKSALMDELSKINRVMKKLDETAPHAVLLVLDATVGQNAISQVDAFARTAGVTGIVLTKLDGTAKGGILVAIADRFGLPVHFVGVGEAVDDLAPFDARAFARAIVGLDESAPS
ncbi:MAG TPA: signal recognition particle-docking protein FtsY [Xanthobacteraceae bacterium]|nr:signal recognition particle-docking protein FtsY [Xanthobacteraceae bacterium]